MNLCIAIDCLIFEYATQSFEFTYLLLPENIVPSWALSLQRNENIITSLLPI